ncbi:MAG TPA: transaldolase, partial [Microbacterium sp.]|nr:transaldolase [Microbacterium sp.]
MIRIEIAETLDLVQEVFRWEIATAVIGAFLDLNPFTQPDVEAAKIASRELMQQASLDGGLPERKADLEADGVRLMTAPALGDAASRAAGDPGALIRALLDTLVANDTFVVNAFLEDAPSTRAVLQSIRETVGNTKRVATTLDFGPRYLHSTGQLQKGGPNRVVGLHLWQSAGTRP